MLQSGPRKWGNCVISLLNIYFLNIEEGGGGDERTCAHFVKVLHFIFSSLAMSQFLLAFWWNVHKCAWGQQLGRFKKPNVKLIWPYNRGEASALSIHEQIFITLFSGSSWKRVHDARTRIRRSSSNGAAHAHLREFLFLLFLAVGELPTLRITLRRTRQKSAQSMTPPLT